MKNYNVTGLNALAKELNQFQIDAGFDNRDVAQRLMLVNTEISELFEAYRKDNYADEMPEYEDDDKAFKAIFELKVKDTMEDEAADTIIRFLGFCAENSIDIEKHIRLKMRYNQLRGHKFGGKKF